MVLHAYGRYQIASICYERARLLDPTAFRWAYYHAEALQSLARLEQAIDAIEAAVDIEPEQIHAKLKHAELRYAAGALPESETLYRSAIAEQPDRVDAHFGLGQTLFRQGDTAGAIEHLEQAIELGGHFGAGHYALAMAYKKSGSAEAAARHFGLFERHKDARLKAPNPFRTALTELELTAQKHLDKARVLYDNGRVADATEELKAALRLNELSSVVHIKLMEIYAELGRNDDAEAQHEHASRVLPDHPSVHFTIGWIRLNRGRYPQAVEAFERVIGLDPDYADAYAQLGQALEQQGQGERATPEYRRALERKPRHRLFHYLLGRRLVLEARYEAAIPHLQQSVEVLDEQTPVFLQTLAQAHVGLGQVNRAINILRQARVTAFTTGNARLVESIDSRLAELEAEKAGTSGGT